MKIIKRNKQVENYDRKKIENAIRKSFQSLESDLESDKLNVIIEDIENVIKASEEAVSVEIIQDVVEEKLMNHGFFKEAKSYILYRQERAELRKIIKEITAVINDEELETILYGIADDFKGEQYALSLLHHKFKTFLKENMTADEALEILIKASAELISKDAPEWEYIAARLLTYQINLAIDKLMVGYNVDSFYSKIQYLTNEGYYGKYILENYTEDQINELAAYMKPERNDLFTYSGLDLIENRYLITDHSGITLEKPQEMFMGIAMHLAMPEGENKVHWAKKIYDILSKLQVTMATPTLSNARKPYHQLSSCFIDTVDDSLDGIYKSLDNFAQVSKFGGGMGMYFGKVRAVGSEIRGFEGAAGGVIRWIRLVNDTAVAVDQLGVRQGAVAVYLDAWHKDLPEFLQLRTNNGDDRMKAHDVFPAVAYPDLFWELARDDRDADWHLMCPHEIKQNTGYSLEDSFGEEWERKYKACVANPNISKRTIKVKELIRLILRSAVETGTPFTFNRDHVNKMNPNKHEGVIYSSNLCTEILQNMSPLEMEKPEIIEVNGEQVVVERSKPGDFVVCNLASLVLGNIDVHNHNELEDITRTVVRALDNVVDLNYYPVPYAEITNQKYRSIGLGVSGYHHLLTQNGLAFESEEHLEFVDKVFEDINYYAVKASHEIAKEKGSYSLFEGSDWDNGDYFELRDYKSERWNELRNAIHEEGLRNAYIMAIAPTSSTSIIAGTTAGIDPIMNKFFFEEKKGSMIARVAPELNDETFWLYKNAHHIDQQWVVKAAGVRSRHIDQAQSMNLYITNEIKMSELLNLFIKAWEDEVKTIYYVRSQSLEVEECESCAS